jgi:hypothetical protein
VVEYATIVTALALIAASVTGAYGNNVAAIFANKSAGVAAASKAANAAHAPASEARAAYQRAPYTKPALKYLYALGWIAGKKHLEHCGAALVGELGQMRHRLEQGVRKNAKLMVLLERRAITARAAVAALLSGIESACT